MAAAWVPAPAWLWSNEHLADVTLQLRTAVVVSDADTVSGTNGVHTSRHGGAVAPASPSTLADSPAGCKKVARHGDGHLTAPEVARTVNDGDQGADSACLISTNSATPCINSGSVAAAAATSRSGRSYPAHSVVLATCSAYFRTRLAAQPGGGSSNQPTVLQYTDRVDVVGSASSSLKGTAGGRTLLVEHVEECELDVMEALLRFCYTGQLCNSSEEVGKVEATMLVKMAELADRFDILLCTQRCCDELHKRAPADFDIPAINAILESPAGGLRSCAAFPSVVQLVTQQLMRLFGDAEAVCQACFDDDDKFLQVGHAGLLLLLGSDALKARSENSVLMMADAWVESHEPHCTPGQLQQIAQALRLGQLTHTFLFDVLPQLKWIIITCEESAFLLRFWAADVLTQEDYRDGDHLVGPATWYTSTPRSPAASANGRMTLEINKAQLAAAISGPAFAMLSSYKLFFNGFLATIRFDLDDESGFRIGHRVSVARLTSGNRLKYISTSTSSVYSMGHPNWHSSKDCPWDGNLSEYERSTIVLSDWLGLPVSAQRTLAAWAPYFSNDMLVFECELGPHEDP